MNLDRIIAVRNDKTVYHDGNFSIKAFRSSVPMSYILQEAFFLSVAEEVGLNVPKFHSVVEHEGRWTIVSDYIKGHSLAELYAKEGSKKADFLDHFVDLQIQVLTKTYCGLPSSKGLIRARVESSTLDASVKLALLRNLESMPDGDQLCHGDFTFSNIIQTPDGRSFILDWSKACLGTGDNDAAVTYLLLLRKFGDDVAHSYLDLYCKKALSSAYAVNKWIPFVSAMKYSVGNRMDREFYGKYFL